MPQRKQAACPGLGPPLPFGPARLGVDRQRGSAAVHRHDRAVYEARVVREEVGDGRRHLPRASARVSPSVAALAVTYGRAPGTARCAWWEETLTIAPPSPAARKRRTAVAQPTTARPRLRATRSSTSRVGAAWSEASRKTAALLTHPRSVPASSARSAALPATASFEASPTTGITRAPAGCSSIQAVASRSISMTTTLSRSPRSLSTIARPTPRPPPVTTYERPTSLPRKPRQKRTAPPLGSAATIT